MTSILLTHSHYDHTNLVKALTEKFNCQVYMSEKEIDYYGFKCKNLNPVNHLETVKFSRLSFDCILTPGHTVGSMCFKLEDSLFTGDTLFIRGCGICSCKGGDYDEMFESIKKIKEIVKDKVLIYPGHYYKGDLNCASEYFKRNIYFHIKDKDVFKKLISMSSKKNNYEIYER